MERTSAQSDHRSSAPVPGGHSRQGVHDRLADAHRTESVTVSASAQPFPTRYVWYVIVLLSVVNVFNYMDRMALSVLMPAIKADLELSDGQLGLLTGFAFALFYALCGIPIARLADRGSRKTIIAIALATWSVMTALSGTAQNFWHLFATRVGIGAGEAGCIPPAQSLICDYVPLKRRSSVFAIHSFGLYVGMMLGMGLAGWLGETIGWRLAFMSLGLPGVVLAAVVALTLREPVRGTFDVVQEPRRDASPPLRLTIGTLLSCETYRLLALFMVINGFVQSGLNQWWPSFYARSFELPRSSIGVYLGVALGVGSGVGLLVGGMLANRVARRDVKLPLALGAACTLAALPAAIISLVVGSASVSLLLVLLTSILWCASNGPALASMYSVVAPRTRALAGAIAIFATAVLGAGLGPLVVGLLSDLLAPDFGLASLRYALLAPACLLPAMAFALYAAARALPHDLARASAQASKPPLLSDEEQEKNYLRGR
jgi:predicted MFS family arabinose efflux permease